MWKIGKEVKDEERISLKKALEGSTEKKDGSHLSSIVKFPSVSLSQAEQEDLNNVVWPKDLDFKVKPDLTNSKLAFIILFENMSSSRTEDEKSDFLSKISGQPFDPTKPRSTPFDDLDLEQLWGSPEKDGIEPLRRAPLNQVEHELKS